MSRCHGERPVAAYSSSNDPRYIVRVVGLVEIMSAEMAKLVRTLAAWSLLGEPVAIESASNLCAEEAYSF